MRAARRLLASSPRGGSDLDEAVGRELARGFHGSAASLRADRSQSALVRHALELLVAATEKVARDLRYAEEYRAVAAEQAEDDELAGASMLAAADLWRDE